MLADQVKFCSGCGQPQTSINEEGGQDLVQNIPGINQPAGPASKKPNMNKWIYIGIAVVIAFFAYTFFIKSTPEKVAKEFVESVYSFDFENAMALMAFSADDNIVDEIKWVLEELRYDPESANEELKMMQEEGYIIKQLTVRDKTQTKNHARVSIDMVMENGEEDTGYIELVKEDGKWKVTYID